ncbi:hypothetical protein CsatB_002976 [Cannabis sativa]
MAARFLRGFCRVFYYSSSLLATAEPRVSFPFFFLSSFYSRNTKAMVLTSSLIFLFKWQK